MGSCQWDGKLPEPSIGERINGSFEFSDVTASSHSEYSTVLLAPLNLLLSLFVTTCVTGKAAGANILPLYCDSFTAIGHT